MAWTGGPDGSSGSPCCGREPESGEGSGIPIQGGTVGALQGAGQSTEESSPLSLVEDSLLPLIS